MNIKVVGGYLAFAIGVGGLTQAYLEAVPKMLATHANDVLSGKATAQEIAAQTGDTTTVAPVERKASGNYGLATYREEPAPAHK